MDRGSHTSKVHALLATSHAASREMNTRHGWSEALADVKTMSERSSTRFAPSLVDKPEASRWSLVRYQLAVRCFVAKLLALRLLLLYVLKVSSNMRIFRFVRLMVALAVNVLLLESYVAIPSLQEFSLVGNATKNTPEANSVAYRCDENWARIVIPVLGAVLVLMAFSYGFVYLSNQEAIVRADRCGVRVMRSCAPGFLWSCGPVVKRSCRRW